MEEVVKKLRDAMIDLSRDEEMFLKRKKEFAEENSSLVEAINKKNQTVLDLKSVISELAIDEFKKTGKKKLYGGIGIQERKSILYDEIKAFDFAREKNMFLCLDKKAFESAAPSLNLDFVVARKDLKATFPKEIICQE